MSTNPVKPIDLMPTNGPCAFDAVLKSLYFVVKKVSIRGGFYKGMGRFVDLNGRSTIWFEVTGNTAEEVLQRSQLYLPPKAGTFKKLIIKRSNFHSGQHCVNLTPTSANPVTCVPISKTHAD